MMLAAVLERIGTESDPAILGELQREYEKRALDQVRTLLDDIKDCAQAEDRVRWIEGAPILVIAFNHAAIGSAVPAFGIRLSRKPSNASFEGDELRRVIRNGIEKYLFKHGVSVVLPPNVPAN